MTLRFFTKLHTFSVLFLILAGSLVTSHGAGLAVPDWPTTFGQNMFGYPISKWTGLVFFEHSHRIIATIVGVLTIVLTSWIWLIEKRKWVKILGLLALAAVILQGLLGGMTVLLKLPPVVSSAHAVLAQTFLLISLVIAYSQTDEWKESSPPNNPSRESRVVFALGLIALIALYLQLIIGAFMRHTDAGLAILDFPTMAGSFGPTFDNERLKVINELRAHNHLYPASEAQVLTHFAHRLGGLLVAFMLLSITFYARSAKKYLDRRVMKTAYALGAIALLQFTLGALTVLTLRAPHVASTHVVLGAILLGLTVILTLQALLKSP